MSEKNNALLAMLGQYENKANSYAQKSDKKYDLNNYFTTHLPDKQRSATKYVRILPTKDGSTPFVEVYGHKVQVEGEWKTFACLQHEKNQDCPFCEAHDQLRATNSETDKELAKKYNARPMYIVKLIDRDNEDHGVKFWRFNHDFRKQGILDKIYGVLQAVKKDITDADTGRDLMIMLNRDQNNRPVVQTIQSVDPTPLSADANLAKEWLADERTWEDVYSLKPYDYLEIIVKGGVPTWDKEAKKYVDKNAQPAEGDNVEAEISLGVPNVKPSVTEAKVEKQAVVAVEESDNESDDDLPF